MKILIVKPSSLGDILHAFPAVARLRQEFPDATIAWVAAAGFAGILDAFPAVDDVIVFRRRRWARPRYWLELIAFVRDLRRRRFDLALDFQGLLRSGLITRLSGARRRIGFRHAREGAALFYTERVRVPADRMHAVDKNLCLVRQALGTARPPPDPELVATADAAAGARRLFRDHDLSGPGPLLAVAPGARWASKAWPASFFATVVDRVAASVPGLRCWVLGSEDERAVAGELIRSCARIRPADLTGATNLGTLVELLRQSSVLLTNDSGPMHVAAALHVPTVALFGPTDPARTGPHGSNHAVVIGKCALQPCFKRTCPLSERVCVAGVSAAAVADRVLDCLRTAAETTAGPDRHGSDAACDERGNT